MIQQSMNDEVDLCDQDSIEDNEYGLRPEDQECEAEPDYEAEELSIKERKNGRVAPIDD